MMTDKEYSLSVILPTFNEADNIEEILATLSTHLSDMNYEIIVVDDDSPDMTWKRAATISETDPRIKVHRRIGKRGLPTAISDGIKMARGSIVMWMDADLSMPAATIPLLVDAVKNGADLSMGSRYIDGGGIKGADAGGKKTSLFLIWKRLHVSEDSFLSAMISVWGNKLIKLILRVDIHDFSSGFFAGLPKTFEDIPIEGDIIDYCIALPYKAIMKGRKVVEVPMVLAPRKNGVSKTSDSLLSIFLIAAKCFFKTIELKLTVRRTE